MNPWARLSPTTRSYQAAQRALANDFSGPVWPIIRDVAMTKGGRPKPLARCLAPIWDGSPAPGQTLFVWSGLYNGYGDIIQACRLLAAAKRQFAGRVVFRGPAGLARLCRSLRGPDAVIEAPAIPPCDAQCPLDWLPMIAGCALTPALLQGGPYLFAEPALVEHCRPICAVRRQVHVGLHWRANPRAPSGASRTIPLDAWAPVLAVQGATFYSLQPDGTAELCAAPQVVDLGHVDDPSERFVHTAAILTHLDVLIGVDSALAHLAGALGGPTCLVLVNMIDVRWGTRSRTPWYPRHALFRNRHPGRYAEVMDQVRQVLEANVERLRLAHQGTSP